MSGLLTVDPLSTDIRYSIHQQASDNAPGVWQIGGFVVAWGNERASRDEVEGVREFKKVPV